MTAAEMQEVSQVLVRIRCEGRLRCTGGPAHPQEDPGIPRLLCVWCEYYQEIKSQASPTLLKGKMSSQGHED